MDFPDIIDTLHTSTQNTVTCQYADIYLDNDFCDSSKESNDIQETKDFSRSGVNQENDLWTSPSDRLIGLVDLLPPLTSKISRGKTHEGILSIGDAILEKERNVFFHGVEKLLEENDELWNIVLENEKRGVTEIMIKLFQQVFKRKTAIMRKEISNFYQKTLSELEIHIKSEMKIKAESLQISIITQLKNEIQEQLKKSRYILQKSLNKKFDEELHKVKTYYQLLLKHENLRYRRLKNKLLQEKNDALRTFYNQMEAERHTSAMYVMSLERKKCRMRRMLLEKFQNAEMKEHLQKLKERDIILDDLEKKDVPVSVINKEWEERIVKILQLFLKFISFCLKLLPEQTTFLLDFENMVIVQLYEMQQQPLYTPVTLITDEYSKNVFQFDQPESESFVCDKEPFTVVGDLSPTPPPLLAYGSKETIDTDVDLPHFRVQRQYVYAKCHGFDKIKKVLKEGLCDCVNNVCECNQFNITPSTSSEDSLESKKTEPKEKEDRKSISLDISLNEKLEDVEINRLYECPDKCGKWIDVHKLEINSYLDFTEENFEKVKLKKIFEVEELPETIKIKDIAVNAVVFPDTGEKFNTIGTQCSREESLDQIPCTCQKIEDSKLNVAEEVKIKDALVKRQRSLNKLLEDNPKLINIVFSDESYDNKF